MKDIHLQLSVPGHSMGVLDRIDIQDALALLTQSEQQAVRAKYGFDNSSMEEVAVAEGVSVRTVERKCESAENRLRRFLDSH